MPNTVVYEVVEHDGGWAYKVSDTFSDTYPTREAAEEAALAASRRQQLPGEPEAILFEDEEGNWHEELVDGADRPATTVTAPEAIDEEGAGAARLAGSPAEKQDILPESATGGTDDRYVEDEFSEPPTDVIATLETAVRRSPLAAVALAFLTGFLLARWR